MDQPQVGPQSCQEFLKGQYLSHSCSSFMSMASLNSKLMLYADDMLLYRVVDNPMPSTLHLDDIFAVSYSEKASLFNK